MAKDKKLKFNRELRIPHNRLMRISADFRKAKATSEEIQFLITLGANNLLSHVCGLNDGERFCGKYLGHPDKHWD